MCTVDASSFDVERLRPLLESKTFSDRLEFVHMSDVAIRELFVTERAMEKAGGELLMPPSCHKRSLKQIQKWFLMGSKQRREAMATALDVTIIPSVNDDTIYWSNGAWRNRPPCIPSIQKTCGGITREYILSLDPRRYDDNAS